uniref:Protein yippee-like n=1 Tax=Calidris pygmaea TaxID=425635 RepID=A0A8C3KN02_9CHAR
SNAEAPEISAVQCVYIRCLLALPNVDGPVSSRDALWDKKTLTVLNRNLRATGRAFLFNKVVNLQYSEVQDRVMLTGRHMVRDVSCKNCNSKLGWIYEFATEDSQRYKEGRVILERALVRESEGFEEHVPSDNS